MQSAGGGRGRGEKARAEPRYKWIQGSRKRGGGENRWFYFDRTSKNESEPALDYPELAGDEWGGVAEDEFSACYSGGNGM